MDFEVTALRKRPKVLTELVGQEFVTATLTNALDTRQTAHAYLFSGPRGTGKTSTARILARSLNCEEGTSANPCRKCTPCQEIANGTSPDVIEIDGASHTSVNDVREIKSEVLYAPQHSAFKIYIIDEVHMLSNSAFNALLKTIEEPPPYVIFIFATTEFHKIPATIRSRCQQFRFRLLTPELILEKLSEAAREAERTFEEEALYWIAKEAQGSMRDAYTLFDQVISFSQKKITYDEIRKKMGLIGYQTTVNLLNMAAIGQTKQCLESIQEIINSGISAEQILLELTDCIRTLVLLQSGIEESVFLGVSKATLPENALDNWNISQLNMAAEDAFALYRDIRYSLNPRYELELYIERLCRLSSRLDSSDILDNIRDLRKELLSHQDETSATPPPIAQETRLDTSPDIQNQDKLTAPESPETTSDKTGTVELVKTVFRGQIIEG